MPFVRDSFGRLVNLDRAELIVVDDLKDASSVKAVFPSGTEYELARFTSPTRAELSSAFMWRLSHLLSATLLAPQQGAE